MTYGLVFDDNAAVWGGSAGEEAKARTVKDYWENIVSNEAQGRCSRQRLRAAAGRRSWRSPGPASPRSTGTRAPAPAAATATPTTNARRPTTVARDPGPPPASNKFSVLRKTISSKTGKATVSVGCRARASWSCVTAKVKAREGQGKKKRSRSASPQRRRGRHLQPDPQAERRGQEGAAEEGQLKVTLKITFAPDRRHAEVDDEGGDAEAQEEHEEADRGARGARAHEPGHRAGEGDDNRALKGPGDGHQPPAAAQAMQAVAADSGVGRASSASAAGSSRTRSTRC